jgi:hypothetical protein
MKKYINIQDSNNTVVRVLSITDSATSPNGLDYIEIDYIEKPDTNNADLDIAYPMYNKSTREFYWVVVNYQNTATDVALQLEETKHRLSVSDQLTVQLTDKLSEANQTIASLNTQLNALNEVVDLLAETQADIIGGAL